MMPADRAFANIAPGGRSFAHVTSGRILERTVRRAGSGGQGAGGLSFRGGMLD
jgi:hypothetical protein